MQQLTTAVENFEKLSIAVDERAGVRDTAYCAVFVQGVDKNFNFTAELLDLVDLKVTFMRHI